MNNYTGLDGMGDELEPHLGGNIAVGDPFTFCPLAWRYIVDRFGIKSVLDLGSGCGNASLFFHRLGLAVVAVDGLRANVDKAVFPTVCHDLTKGPMVTRVDLVHCQEVAEHIDQAFVDNLIDSLLCGQIIVMTHALPGQGGYHHVNLQGPEYWIELMTARGAVLLEEDTQRIRDFARRDGAPYMSATGLVFANRTASEESCAMPASNA